MNKANTLEEEARSQGAQSVAASLGPRTVVPSLQGQQHRAGWRGTHQTQEDTVKGRQATLGEHTADGASGDESQQALEDGAVVTAGPRAALALDLGGRRPGLSAHSRTQSGGWPMTPGAPRTPPKALLWLCPKQQP